MVSKKIEPHMAAHLGSLLRAIIDRDFGGNGTAAARGLGLSQSHLNQIVNGTGSGPGLSTLIVLRAYTGLSIDQLLGLAPTTAQAQGPRPLDLDAVRALVRDEIAALEKTGPRAPDPRPAKPRKAPRSKAT